MIQHYGFPITPSIIFSTICKTVNASRILAPLFCRGLDVPEAPKGDRVFPWRLARCRPVRRLILGPLSNEERSETRLRATLSRTLRHLFLATAVLRLKPVRWRVTPRLFNFARLQAKAKVQKLRIYLYIYFINIILSDVQFSEAGLKGVLI